MILESVLASPKYGAEKLETMPTDACQFFYAFTGRASAGTAKSASGSQKGVTIRLLQAVFVTIVGCRPDLRATEFKRRPIVLAASGAATNTMGTQKAARTTESGCRPSPRPLAFATRPAIVTKVLRMVLRRLRPLVGQRALARSRCVQPRHDVSDRIAVEGAVEIFRDVSDVRCGDHIIE